MMAKVATKLDLKELLSNPPNLHKRMSDGELISIWRIDDTTCLELDRRLKPGMKTLETGAGLSTILFAANGCHHTAIMPDKGLDGRIVAYCEENGIDTSEIKFILSKSTDTIHQMGEGYDLVLIDGTHGFPAALVDFYYATKMLKTGGTLIIDDMHIYTCKLIALFMQEDPGWDMSLFTDRVAIGTKIADTIDTEWVNQAFVMRRSAGAPSLTKPLTALRATVTKLRSDGLAPTIKKISQRIRQTS